MNCAAGERLRRLVGPIVRMRNEEVLHRIKEERNILHTINRREAKWISPILYRNYLLKHVVEGNIEGSIEVTGKSGRRRKQLLYDLKKIRGYRKFKEKALDRSLRGPLCTRSTCRKTDYRMNVFDTASEIFLAKLICVSNNYYYRQCGI